MKQKLRIAIRCLPTPESVVSLGPTISALKRKHEDAAVGLVADESLREASLLLPELDFFATELEGTHADTVLDLISDEALEDSAEDPSWKAYLSAATTLTHGNPFHLIDLLKKAARVDSIDVNFELALPDSAPALPDALNAPSGVRVGICASSLDHAQVEQVLEALSRLPSPAEVFLLGTVKDKRHSAQISATWDGRLNVYDLCGHYGILGQAALLRACDLNVVGPGLSALLSAGFGTFTVCIDPTPTRGTLLYPYGHGHLLIQPASPVPLAESLSAFFTSLVGYALSANNGNVPTLEQWQQFADSMIFDYLGKLRLLGTQRIEIPLPGIGSITELYLRPLLFTGSEPHDVFLTFYRLLWEHSYSQRSITTFDLQILHQETMPALREMLGAFEQFFELANFGQTYSGYVRESLGKGELAKAKHEANRLQEVEELMQTLTSTRPFLQPLYAAFRQEQRLLAGESPLELAEEMVAIFAGLQDQVIVLLDLTKSLFHTVFEKENGEAGSEAPTGASPADSALAASASADLAKADSNG